MKHPCIIREQSLGIHDVVNDQANYTFKHGQPFGSFLIPENQCSKAIGWIDLFAMLNVFLRSKYLSMIFLKDIMYDKITVIDHQHREM